MKPAPEPTVGDAGDRLDELLAADALDEISASERDELERLVAQAGPDDSFDRAAACIFLAHAPSVSHPLPDHLARILEATAVGWSAAQDPEESRRFRHLGANDPAQVSRREADGAGASGHRRSRWRAPMAAAALVFVVAALAAALWPAFSTENVADRRLALIGASDTIRWSWAAWDNPGMDGVTGDVVWSDANQRGYMLLRGLPANDPSVEQYQLWIVDSRRGLETRFNGGVFDVNSAGEAIVPIRSELKVDRPQLFAITIENPGGTGISDMKRRAVLAKRPG